MSPTVFECKSVALNCNEKERAELRSFEKANGKRKSKNYDSILLVFRDEVIVSSQNIPSQPLYQNADWML